MHNLLIFHVLLILYIHIVNTAWRAWDFLWMLHIMDYDDRDDIGTWLLKLFSVLALTTAIAGIALYALIPRRARP